MRDAVPVKYLSISVLFRPMASKHLRAAIALQRGNAHLRENLQQSLVDGLLVILQRRLESDARRQVALRGLVFQRLDGQIRIHRARAVADQQAKCITSRGSPDSMISATCVRVPSRTR